MRKILMLLMIVVVLGACKSKYEQLLASNDSEAKEKAARAYYAKGDYFKASDLFKDLISAYSGSTKVEEMFFLFAMCDFNLKDYGLAAYEFSRLVEKFPRGTYTERCYFLMAEAYAQNSDPHYLDQADTYKAIDAFQLFIDRYPNSTSKDSANTRIDELRYKIELKAFEKAKLYHKLGDYQSAVVAYQDLLLDYPDIRHHEEIYFSIVKAAKQLAEQSVEAKKVERYKDVFEYADEFIKRYPKSELLNIVKGFKEGAKVQIETLKMSIPAYYVSRKQYDLAIKSYSKLLDVEKDTAKLKQIHLKLMEAYYADALTAPTELKITKYKKFLDEAEALKGRYKKAFENKMSKEFSEGKLAYEKYKSQQAYKLLSEGKYQMAVNSFDTLLMEKDLENRDRHIYYAFKANHKLAKLLPAKNELEILNYVKTYAEDHKADWQGKAYASKISKLLEKNQKLLAEFPVKLVEQPFKNGAYKSVLAQAPTLIKNNNSSAEKEEIVYLQVLAAYRHARNGKRFEKQARFKVCKDLITNALKEEMSSGMHKKLNQLALKVDKKIAKYQIED